MSNGSESLDLRKFQSPEGDSGLCYLITTTVDLIALRFQSPEGDSGLCYLGVVVVSSLYPSLVSVPRRGFRSLLHGKEASNESQHTSFSPPKGIQVFVTRRWPAPS